MGDRANKIKDIREKLGTLPHQVQKVNTKFYRGVEGIQVDLIDAPHNPYRAMFTMATATWGAATSIQAARWQEITPENRFELVKSVLMKQALPLAVEAAKFTFTVQNLSRWSFDQIARARLGVVFASLGTRDNNHADIPFRFHESTFQNGYKLRMAKEVAMKAKEMYGRFLLTGISSWQEARELLPISVVHRFVMSINFAALQNMCSRRMTFSEAEDTVAVAWLLRDRLNKPDAFPLLAQFLRPMCDYTRSCCYHKAHTASEAFGCLYKSCGRNPVKSAPGMPEVDPDLAEYNEACTNSARLAKQLGIDIPEPDQQRPEEITFDLLCEKDRLLFEEEGSKFNEGPSGKYHPGYSSWEI